MFSYTFVSSIDALVSDFVANNWYAKHNWSDMIGFPLSTF